MDIKLTDYTQIGQKTNEEGYIINCFQYDDEIIIGQKTYSGNEVLLTVKHKKLKAEIIKDIISKFGFDLIVINS